MSDATDTLSTSMPAGDVAAQTLLERARRLGATVAGATDRAGLQTLVFTLAEERYAVDVCSLRSVEREDGLTPLPCTPAFIAGILNLRGELLTVLDLAVALGLPPRASAPAPRVVVVEVADGRVGLRVDEVLGVESITVADLEPSISGRDFARGVSNASTVLLDVQQLLAGARFLVSDDVA